MKKRIFSMICILLVTVFLNACAQTNCDETPVYESGVFCDKNWDEKLGAHERDAIPDAETALAVATAICEGRDFDHEKIPFQVFYDVEDEIWIVFFRRKPESPDTFYTGSGFNIAMRKSDGKVLCMWSTE